MRKWVVVQGRKDKSIWGVRPTPGTLNDVIYVISEASADNLCNILNELERQLDNLKKLRN